MLFAQGATHREKKKIRSTEENHTSEAYWKCYPILLHFFLIKRFPNAHRSIKASVKENRSEKKETNTIASGMDFFFLCWFKMFMCDVHTVKQREWWKKIESILFKNIACIYVWPFLWVFRFDFCIWICERTMWRRRRQQPTSLNTLMLNTHWIWWSLHSFRMWMNYNVYGIQVLVLALGTTAHLDWSGRLNVYCRVPVRWLWVLSDSLRFDLFSSSLFSSFFFLSSSLLPVQSRCDKAIFLCVSRWKDRTNGLIDRNLYW